jgi:hypothetical protein
MSSRSPCALSQALKRRKGPGKPVSKRWALNCQTGKQYG